MRWSIIISVALSLTCLRGQDYLNGDFDIDNRAALVQILRNSVKGKWHTHANKTLPFDEFKQQSGRQYLRYEKDAFSGWYGQWDDNGTLRNLRRFSEGKLEGSVFSWRENGDKFHQGRYKGGKKDGTFTYWNNNLERIKELNYKQGKLDGVCTAWYGNGNKSSVQTFINGKILNAKGWKPNGDYCPSTKVVDGIGVVVFYDEDKKGNLQTLSKIEYIIERYENGNKREEGSYLNGKKEGLWIYYRTDGTEFFRTTYESGRENRPPFAEVKE